MELRPLPTISDTRREVERRTPKRLPTADEVRAFVAQYDFFGDAAVRQYLDVALDRLLHTLSLLRSLPLHNPRVLEIGAHPYFMTMLLREHLDCHVTALNEPVEGAPAQGVREIRHLETGRAVEIPYVCANVEQQTFPLDSETFDLVIFAEVIEHLTHDPTRALTEIHRVLKTGGYLLISTPNALRWEYLRRMLRGENYYPPYSGYGTTARHNREFSIAELRDLVTGCGFEVLESHTARDAAYDHPEHWESAVKIFNRFGFWRDRLDVIHLIARKLKESRICYPDYLYYDLNNYRRVLDNSVKMGTNDQLQIDHFGFYPLEEWPPKVRWTRERATVYLRGDGQKSIRLRFFSGDRPKPVTGSVLVNGNIAGRFNCEPSEWFEGEFLLTSAVTGEVEVALQTDEVISPRASRTADSRDLGVALQWIELR